MSELSLNDIKKCISTLEDAKVKPGKDGCYRAALHEDIEDGLRSNGLIFEDRDGEYIMLPSGYKVRLEH